MAKVYEENGRCVRNQVVGRRSRQVTVAMWAVAALGAMVGFCLALSLRITGLPFWACQLTFVAVILAALLVGRRSLAARNALKRERVNYSNGATGEALVAHALADFPNEYSVLKDVVTPYGNLDHVVIGPTGVFILETKNWKGIVTSDRKGELLLNGNPLDKAYIRRLVARVMNVKERARALTNGLNPYFQALFVFTSARVAAKWGTTGFVHCLTDDQLKKYIIEDKRGIQLTSAQVKILAQAFLGLARMESNFAVVPRPFKPRHHPRSTAARNGLPLPFASGTAARS